MRERLAHWLAVVLLLGQLAGLAIQVPDEAWRGSLLEAAVLRTVGPVLRAVTGVTGGVGAAAGDLRTHRSLRDENAMLKARVAMLERELLRLQGLEAQATRLAAAVDYAPPVTGRLRVADVVYIDHLSWLRTLVVHVGDGTIERNQPVVVEQGLVGRVIAAATPYAKVQLLTDRAAIVGAMVARTRRQGVARGAGEGVLELAFLPKQATVEPGDLVVTSGVDGVYPRGIPIGIVQRVGAGDGLFHDIELVPAVDFGELDQVYLLPAAALPPELTETDGRP